jgi:HEAT repeat protein
VKRSAAIACLGIAALTVVAGADDQRGGISNTTQAPLALTIEEVLLAADRMRADRWYPNPTELGDDHTGRVNRAADMDLLVLASRHPRPDLRLIAVREFGRFETPANVTFLAPFLDDPERLVRAAAADALVQSVVDRPDATQEIAFVIAAIEERLKREVQSSARGDLWLRLAELPLTAPAALRWEREWMSEIQQLKPLKFLAADALLRMLQAHPRQVEASTEAAFENWVRSALSQGDRRVMIGTAIRGATLQYLEILQAMRADNDDLAAEAAGFICRVDFTEPLQECSAPIRDLGVRLLNPHNPRHQPALETAARNRLHPVGATTAIRKLIAAPGMPLCTLLEMSNGMDVEREVIEALEKVKPERYEACPDWDPSQHLLSEAQRLNVSTTLTTWVVPATAYETLAKRLAADEAKGALHEPLMLLHKEVGVPHLRWEVRAAAARVATSMEDVATLATLAGDDHHNVRAEALKGLVTLKSPVVFAAAIDALQFPDAHLTMTAATALAGMPDPSVALETVFAALERLTKPRRDTSRRARLALLERLAAFIPSGATEVQIWTNKLSPLLTDVDPAVAEAAAALIAKVSGTSSPARPTRRPGFQPNAARIMAIPPCFSIKFEGAVQDVPVVLDRLVAPVAIARLVELINAGYYNGTVIHDLDENIGVGGSPAANNEGGLERVIRDEVGNLETGPQLVLMGHERDYADGRLGIRSRANPSRFRRETVLGPLLDFPGMSKGDTISRMWVGAPDQYTRPRMPCDPTQFGIPGIIPRPSDPQ